MRWSQGETRLWPLVPLNEDWGWLKSIWTTLCLTVMKVMNDQLMNWAEFILAESIAFPQSVLSSIPIESNRSNLLYRHMCYGSTLPLMGDNVLTFPLNKINTA